MDKCPNCGNKINRMDVLCPRCGAVVEDVQVKIALKANKGVSGTSEFAIPKKSIPQNFIVYNEDFPSEEYETYSSTNTEDESADIDPSVYGNAAGIPEPEDEHDYYVPSDTEVPPDEYDEEESDLAGSKSYVPGTLKAIKEQEETDNEDYSERYLEKTKGQEETDNEDYSERYLEKIKDLPEIDDISNFDPEEYMKKYRLSKGMYGEVPVMAVPENNNFNEKVTKHYLEIEEIIPTSKETLTQEQVLAVSAVEEKNEFFPDAEPSFETESSLETSARESEPVLEQSEVQPEEAPAERRYNPESAPVEHRYNPDVPRRYRKKERLEHKINQGKAIEAPPVEARTVEAPPVEALPVEVPPVEAPLVEAQTADASSMEAQTVQKQVFVTRSYRRYEPREESRTPRRNERRHVPAVASAIIWLAVIAALFAGFFFFDRYVKTSYGNYDSFIYNITNGKIDLGTQAK